MQENETLLFSRKGKWEKIVKTGQKTQVYWHLFPVFNESASCYCLVHDKLRMGATVNRGNDEMINNRTINCTINPQHIRAIMALRELKQQELADKLGIAVATMVRRMKPHARWRRSEIIALTRILGVDESALRGNRLDLETIIS